MSIAWFPFDEQLCTIVFGSWSYTANYLNYTVRTADPSLKNFTDNTEWTLLKYKPIRIENKYEHWIEDDYFSEIKVNFLSWNNLYSESTKYRNVLLCVHKILTYSFHQSN